MPRPHARLGLFETRRWERSAVQEPMTTLCRRKQQEPHPVSESTLRQRFLDAMAANSTSVNVVSTIHSQTVLGVTVSACSSVSADPPTLLVCINTRSPACDAIETSGNFAVNLLSAEQVHVAETFAGFPDHGEPFDFACCEWKPGALWAPLILQAIASLECRVVARQTIGTHRIFFGEVVSASSKPGMPLLYCRRDYGRFQPL
jgi:flavin reductase (DIM6/NTAB) family NADH-FMN oxidoreductase RutF